MKRGQTGYYKNTSVGGETVKAFVPNPLPPSPPVTLSEESQELLSDALLALGRLDGITALLPDPSLFLYMYIRKEALLSSQIEGTQSSLSELLLFEKQQVRGPHTVDVVEVSNYVKAMNLGLKKLKDGLPISNRLIRDIHAELLSTGRGSNSQPGEFRRTQNWIGGSRPGLARFVPPPHESVVESMGQLEKFIHDIPKKTPPLLKAALVHVQFETIHPFLDGNGRLGRLLITFLICSERILSEPMLYLSLYFKSRRDEYYELLQRVRTEGTWEEWIDFFLRGVAQTSDQAIATAKRLLGLFRTDRNGLTSASRHSKSLILVYDYLTSNPISSVSRAADSLKLTYVTVNNAFKRLLEFGILEELTGGARNRVFIYKQYLDILNEGTEPL